MIRRVVVVGQRLLERKPVSRELVLQQVTSPATEIFVWSRIAIWAAALFAWLVFEPNRHPRVGRWDAPFAHDLGQWIDVWARWDSVWLIQIAEHGYRTPVKTAAFFPLYPGALAATGRALGGHYV